MGSLHKNIQLMLKFLKALFLVLHFFNTIVIYADNNTLSSKCEQISDLWQQLELAFVNEYDLKETVDWGRKWLVDFNAGKTQLVPFDWSNNSGNIDMKINRSVLEKKTIF